MPDNQPTTAEPEPKHKPKLKWTIMVYLAGDNNLSANSIGIMQDLEAASSSKDVRVLACYDSNAPLSKGARYLEINHRRHLSRPIVPGMDWGLHNDMVYPGHMVVSPDFCRDKPVRTVKPIEEPTAKEGLSRFLCWALKNHPAEKYMLILFGHGVLVGGNTFLSDTNPPSFLRLNDFAQIIKRHFASYDDSASGEKRKLDILAFDNCVMNNIEVAYAVRKYVDFMVGSQDLMLAIGWPFKRIINFVQENPNAPTKTIARKILKACARHLLDFSLMERSSEQAVIDVKKLRKHTLVDAIRALSKVLVKGLALDECGRVKYPQIRDAIRLARLEAQSYWDETFVDLYDFCELLLNRCNEMFANELEVYKAIYEEYRKQQPPQLDSNKNLLAADSSFDAIDLKLPFRLTELGSAYSNIVERCRDILDEFRLDNPKAAKKRGIVPYSYYVCPNLQYSHGLSIYFPWTLPEAPLMFKPIKRPGSEEPADYEIKTAFDEYKEYAFAKPEAADWATFLIRFFKATLRNVRLVDFTYEVAPPTRLELFKATPIDDVRTSPPINLQKSSSDTGEQDETPGARIKNYPRRYYLSPADCKHRCPVPGEEPYPEQPIDPQTKCLTDPAEEAYKKDRCVSYLGWNIRGLVAEVIGLPPFLEAEDSDADDED